MSKKLTPVRCIKEFKEGIFEFKKGSFYIIDKDNSTIHYNNWTGNIDKKNLKNFEVVIIVNPQKGNSIKINTIGDNI